MTINPVYLWLILPAVAGAVAWLYGVSWRVGVVLVAFSAASLALSYQVFDKIDRQAALVASIGIVVGFLAIDTSALSVTTKRILRARHWLLRILVALMLFIQIWICFQYIWQINGPILNSPVPFKPLGMMAVGVIFFTLVVFSATLALWALISVMTFKRRTRSTM